MKLTHFAALAFVAPAIIGCSKGYTFLLNPEVGKTYTYNFAMTGQFNVAAKISETATKSDSSGVTMDTRLSDMTLNGQPVPGADAIKNMVITMTFDKAGHTQKTKVSGVPSSMTSAMANSPGSSATFPDHPVKVGDTWTGQSNIQGQSMTTSYKFTKVDTVNGVPAAIFEVTPTSGNSAIKFNGPTTMAIEISTGMPLSVTSSAQQGTQSMNMTMTRI